ncbi:hypothetical protein ACLFKS_37375 [Paraburkholderia sp. BR10879]|uniref:hypothetical protein n=1 Tax=Paraburkholderia sp. BR10882 TaxID=3236991 RepID=UPI0034CF28C4
MKAIAFGHVINWSSRGALSTMRALILGLVIGYGVGFLQYGRAPADPLHKITLCAHELEAKERANGITPDDDMKEANQNACAKGSAKLSISATRWDDTDEHEHDDKGAIPRDPQGV